jgi:hypothetical protein
LLAANLGPCCPCWAPHASALRGEASETDRRIEAWFSFETRVGRSRGHVRMQDGRASTLLTAFDELKGHEERVRERWPAGAASLRWRPARVGAPQQAGDPAKDAGPADQRVVWRIV